VASIGRSSRNPSAPTASRWRPEQDFSNALSAALKTKRTTVIGIRIDASGYVAQFNALREL
jgi:hypothetical protein